MKYLLTVLLITSFMYNSVDLAAIRESHEDAAQISPVKKGSNDVLTKLEAVDEEMDQGVYKMRDNISDEATPVKTNEEMKDLQQHNNLDGEKHFPQTIEEPRKIVKRNDGEAIAVSSLETPPKKPEVVSESFHTHTSTPEHSLPSSLDESHLLHHSGSTQTINHKSKIIDLTHSKSEHPTKDSNLHITSASNTTPVTVKTSKTKKKTSSRKSKTGEVTSRSQRKSLVAEDSISETADKEAAQDEPPIVGMPLQTQPDLQAPYNYPFSNPYLSQYMNYPQYNALMGSPFQNPYLQYPQYPMYPNYRNYKKNDDQASCGTSINGGAQQQGSKSAFYQPINIVV